MKLKLKPDESIPKMQKVTIRANAIVKKDSVAFYPRRKKATERKVNHSNVEDQQQE